MLIKTLLSISIYLTKHEAPIFYAYMYFILWYVQREHFEHYLSAKIDCV